MISHPTRAIQTHRENGEIKQQKGEKSINEKRKITGSNKKRQPPAPLDTDERFLQFLYYLRVFHLFFPQHSAAIIHFFCFLFCFFAFLVDFGVQVKKQVKSSTTHTFESIEHSYAVLRV